MKNRVVVTGLGVLAANGIGIDAFWQSLLKGESGVATVTLFNADSLPCNIAGEVKGFIAQQFLDRPIKAKRLARHTQLALAAAAMALKDSKLNGELHNHQGPVPIVMGVSTSSFDLIQNGFDSIRNKGAEYASPFVISNAGPQAIACEIARMFDIRASITTVSTTCAAGVDAIGMAAAMIRSGKADIAIAGSTDAPIAISPYANMVAAGMMSKRIHDPQHASRPFDRERDGGILAEGAGVVILENLEHARARGAVPLAEITGYAVQLDENSREHATGFVDSMTTALANASRLPQDVDFVNAHGPSDPLLDRVETEAIKKVLGKRAHQIPVVSIKGATGNPLAAAGSLQVVTTALIFRHGLIPPTTNYEYPDPDCDLDYVPKTPRRAEIGCALINSHGIGGGNSTLVVERVN